jgi:hypothetical protein
LKRPTLFVGVSEGGAGGGNGLNIDVAASTLETRVEVNVLSGVPIVGRLAVIFGSNSQRPWSEWFWFTWKC